jgi:hypothetical protein
VQLAYLLFRDHHILPSATYNLKPGEREVVQAFVRYEYEQKRKEYEEMTKGAS